MSNILNIYINIYIYIYQTELPHFGLRILQNFGLDVSDHFVLKNLSLKVDKTDAFL